jgi:hyperosmotically inducible protein
MKKGTAMIPFLILLVLSGCGTIYGVAVEERKAGAIAADTKIATTIQKRFFDDSDMKTFDLSAYCYNGHVYLVGEYVTARQKEKAAIIARGVEGVKSVQAYLLPKKEGDACGAADNLKIRGKLDAKLVADKGIWSTNIDVKVVQCNIVLLGIVKTKKEINRAVAHARSVEGVRGVTSYLKSTR